MRVERFSVERPFIWRDLSCFEMSVPLTDGLMAYMVLRRLDNIALLRDFARGSRH